MAGRSESEASSLASPTITKTHGRSEQRPHSLYDRRVSELHAPLLQWYDEHARDLPWRRTDTTAWGVLVSELMLQQTPVARVLPVYTAWMERWPTPASLAASPVGDAIRAFAANPSEAALAAIATQSGGDLSVALTGAMSKSGASIY